MTMLGTPRARCLVALAFALAFAGGAGALSDAAWSRLPHPQPLDELAYYPSGVHLKPATVGHAETAADLAWLRAVQYYGEHRGSDNRFERMGHVFDILTTLSPQFVPAYVFGGFALAQEGRDFPAAERLMRKGMEANPRSGELAFELGFMYFVRPGGRDLAKAAECFELASFQPDGPPQAARFAAYARQNDGNLLRAWELWNHIDHTTRNDYLRETARREMRRITHAIETGHVETARSRLTVPRVVIGG